MKVGDTKSETIGPITRQDIVKYAGASGDFNPIHIDEEFAKALGFESVFAMGMLTAAHLGRLVSTWMGLGNIKKFRVRFTEKVWPGDLIHLQAEVTSIQEQEHELKLKLSAVNQNNQTVVSGDALVRMG